MNRKDSDGCYIILTNTQKKLLGRVHQTSFNPDLFGTLTFMENSFKGVMSIFDDSLTQKQHNWLDKHLSKFM